MLEGFGAVAPAAPVVAAHVRAGIDPGKTGWVVAELPDGTLRAWKIPVTDENKYDRQGIIDIAREMVRLGVTHVTLEAQQPTRLRGSQGPMANNAVRASFMTGYGFALWELILDVVGIKFDLAWPSHWKKKMGISAPSDVKDQKKREKLAKANAIKAAADEWPDHDFRRTTRCKPSHDMSEAALLIRYGEQRGWGP